MSGDDFVEASLEEVLARKEARAARQGEVIAERHMTLVSLTVVSPGPIKNSPQIRAIFDEGVATVMVELREIQQWPIWLAEEYDGVTGPELLLAVDGFVGDIKRAMVDVEREHPWGRLWDIDVIGEDGRPVSRAHIGAAPRGCLLCDQPAFVCSRSRRHSLEELQAHIDEMVARERQDQSA